MTKVEQLLLAILKISRIMIRFKLKIQKPEDFESYKEIAEEITNIRIPTSEIQDYIELMKRMNEWQLSHYLFILNNKENK